MKLLKEYLSDFNYPTAEEVSECLAICQSEHCSIQLTWVSVHRGLYHVFINEADSLADVLIYLQKYGVS